jgi:ectoine hydroxylase-related dioxygenase (phytanoyl-CoA dioxygenase family)
MAGPFGPGPEIANAMVDRPPPAAYRQTMRVERFAAGVASSSVAAALARDGCAVVEHLVSPTALARVRDELAPWLAATAYGQDQFAGQRTRRTGGLIARSPACRDLVQHPLVLGAVGEVLGRWSSFHLHLTQVIAIGAGEAMQQIHRDQWAFDFFPFPRGCEVQCNTIWAMTEFTAANGATRVVAGSHRLEDRLQFTEADTEPAEMARGSVLFYTGSLYHGGGANRSEATRYGVNITYNAAWLRQEENQYLSVPLEIARELPEDLLRLMGYARGAYALGYVDDLRDPMDVVRPGASPDGLGSLDRARARASTQLP